jgi:hypothetical protein
MGYSRKVEGSSFPTVVVSDRAAHFIARNLNLKMGFFQTKNRRHWTTRWDNSTKISGIIDLLEVYQMVYLNFNLKIFFRYFWENSVFRVYRHGPTSAVVARKQRPLKIRLPLIYSSHGWTFRLP